MTVVETETTSIAVVIGRRYVGERCAAGCRVAVVDAQGARSLAAPSTDPLASFVWGRPGTRTRDLAWAILCDAADDTAIATDWCSTFAAEVVSHLPYDGFSLRTRDVLRWLDGDRRADPV